MGWCIMFDINRKLSDAACNQSDDRFAIKHYHICNTLDNDIILECQFWYNNTEFTEGG